MVKCRCCERWRPLAEVEAGWCRICRDLVERLLSQVFPTGVTL